MINIKETELRTILKIELGSKGVWTDYLENEIIEKIKALNMCKVGFSLPTEKEAISEMERSFLMENSLPNPIQKEGYAIGFRNGYSWLRDELKPVAN